MMHPDPSAEPVHGAATRPIELSVVMPCLNEARTLPGCIAKARGFIESRRIAGEIVVADNGSTDGSADIARELGAVVVPVAARGYGAALQGGISAACGQYVVMGDADGSYDFGALDPFLAELRAGADLVMGNRFAGTIHPGAMPALHRYLCTPVLTAIGRVFFGSPCSDVQCGLRGISKRAFDRMDLRTTKMEFASEMVIKASLLRMRIAEVPIDLHPDGRDRPPHLRTWRDGWRNLRFLLLYSPRWLFLYPGLALVALGLVSGALLLRGPWAVGGVTLDVRTLIYSAVAVLIGLQAIVFGAFARAFAASEGLLPPSAQLERGMAWFRLEYAAVFGALVAGAGLAGSIYAVAVWGRYAFGALDPHLLLRVVIPSALALGAGIQIVFSAFFLSLLMLGRR
jgi:hypothetical protein